MKVIFLDIDGVLNSINYMHKLIDKNVHEYENNIYQFIDEESVDIIKHICQQYNIKLVITSSWRHFDLDSTIDYFNQEENKKLHPLIPYIIGVTPRLWIENNYGGSKFLDRGYEIKKYLNEHKDITQFVIIDDDTDMLPEQFEYCVFIDNEFGLNKNHIPKILNKLKITKN